IDFVFITGITMFSKANLFSGLNNLKNISLSPRYGTICGYTDHDLDTVFAEEKNYIYQTVHLDSGRDDGPSLMKCDAKVREWEYIWSSLQDKELFGYQTDLFHTQSLLMILTLSSKQKVDEISADLPLSHGTLSPLHFVCESEVTIIMFIHIQQGIKRFLCFLKGQTQGLYIPKKVFSATDLFFAKSYLSHQTIPDKHRLSTRQRTASWCVIYLL
ncbi:MAG: AAA family ATPase, partial [Proteobacteria bacterium]|nr:AAA family ATPase [Pseudomonadota bacterium]